MVAYLRRLDLSEGNLKKFAFTIFIGLFIVGLLLLFNGRQAFKILWIVGFLFMLLARISPYALVPAYKLWMGLAFCTGWANTRLLLFSIYYFVLTPMGLLQKVFRRDILKLKFKKLASGHKPFLKKSRKAIPAGELSTRQSSSESDDQFLEWYGKVFYTFLYHEKNIDSYWQERNNDKVSNDSYEKIF